MGSKLTMSGGTGALYWGAGARTLYRGGVLDGDGAGTGTSPPTGLKRLASPLCWQALDIVLTWKDSFLLDRGGGTRDAHSLLGPIFFIFMHLRGKLFNIIHVG